MKIAPLGHKVGGKGGWEPDRYGNSMTGAKYFSNFQIAMKIVSPGVGAKNMNKIFEFTIQIVQSVTTRGEFVSETSRSL